MNLMHAPPDLPSALDRVLCIGARAATAARFTRLADSATLPPTMRAILTDVLVRGKGMQQMERTYGWPARSAKAIIGVLLDILAESDLPAMTEPESARASARRLLEHLTATRFDPQVAGHMTRFGLTRTESRLLEIMRRAPDMTISRETALARLYPDDDDPPDPKIIDVYLCGMRPKLARHGVIIQTLVGLGWRLHWPYDPPPPCPHHPPAEPDLRPSDTVTDDDLLEYVAQPDADRRIASHMTRFGLTRTEAVLIDALHQACGRIVSRAALHRHLYQESAGAPAAGVIDQMIHNARRKIGPHRWQIDTVRGEGCRLVTNRTASTPSTGEHHGKRPPHHRNQECAAGDSQI